MLAGSSWPKTESHENKLFMTKSVELGKFVNFGDHLTSDPPELDYQFSQILRPLLNCFDQDSGELAHLVEKYLLRPHDPLRPYNLTESAEDILRNYQSKQFDLSLEMEREYFRGQV